MTIRGFINIDKPRGVTSFDVVRRIRRAAATRKVGHAGTLDPNATGVLPVAIGDATRLVDELVGAGKRYTAGIVFGIATDTYDVEGDVSATADASHLTEAMVREALAPFVGEIQQRPPAYSAVKRDGVTAYRAARAGTPLDLAPRPVSVHALHLLGIDLSDPAHPVATVDVRCGKGFYVRSLAHDLGQHLGVGAHLGSLRRTQVGPFLIEHATPLDEAVERLERGDRDTLLLPPDTVIAHWPSVTASDEQVSRIRRGMDIVATPEHGTGEAIGGHSDRLRARCYDLHGGLVALLEATDQPGTWHPYRVFAPDQDPEQAALRTET